MSISTALCFIAWAFVLFNVDPQKTDMIGFAFFYVSFLLALIGSVSLILFASYAAIVPRETPMFRVVEQSFRDAFLISFAFLILVFFQGSRVLSLHWGMLALLFFALLGTGIFFTWASAHQRKPI